MKLSVILVNWKSADYLRACLASLYRCVAGVDFEAIVVENASDDGCEAMLTREFPQVRVIVAPGNLGFARANNLGFTYSTGDVLLFLNPDTEVRDESVQQMAAWIQTHPHVGAAGARLLNSDGSVQQNSVQAFPTLLNQFLDSDILRHWFPRSRLWGMQALSAPHSGAFEVDTISGACFMVRRDVFEAVGRFSEEYFMYADDLDLSYKIRQAGHSVMCLTGCTVIHYGGRSSSQRGACFADVAQRNAMAQFFLRTRGPRTTAAYRMMTAVAAILRLALTGAVLLSVGEGQRHEQMLITWSKWSALLKWSFGRSAGESAVESASMDDRRVKLMPEKEAGFERKSMATLIAARYAIVTPVRDEEAYIEGMIRSIAVQTVPPARWIIVDDGSRDRTAEIVEAFAQQLSFLTLVRRKSASRRLPGGEGAVPDALRRLNLEEFEFLARFDADLLFPENYIERILEQFRSNPQLGIAGGTLYIEKNGGLVAEKVPEVHVRGPVKMYRRECFEDIGGLTTAMGWDTLDEASAWTKGWQTRSFEDIHVIHRRPTGGGLTASEIYYQRGRAEYLTWSDLIFVLGKSVRLLIRDRSIIKPAAYLSGFVGSYLLREKRIQDPAITKARRSQQRDTIRRMLGSPREFQRRWN